MNTVNRSTFDITTAITDNFEEQLGNHDEEYANEHHIIPSMTLVNETFEMIDFDDISEVFPIDQVMENVRGYIIKILDNMTLGNPSAETLMISAQVTLTDNNKWYTCVSRSWDTFKSIVSYYINSNLSTCSLFTEDWGSPYGDVFLMLCRDEHIRESTFGGTFEDDTDNSEDEDPAEFFNEYVEEVIEDKFGTGHHHEVSYSDSSMDPDVADNVCLLCDALKPTVVCETCMYSLCDECLTEIVNRSGECPHCRAYPLKLIRIYQPLNELRNNNSE